MSSNSQEDIKPMISIYKKLFVILTAITAMGICIVLLHVPVWVILVVGLTFIAIKSFIVYESFKHLMVGRNAIIILFSLTIIFLISVLLLPLLNHQGRIVGTEDTSKQLMMQEPGQLEGNHGH